MSGAIGSGSNSNYGPTLEPKKQVKPSVISIPDINNSISNEATSQEFKKQVSGQMGISEDKIQIVPGKSGLVAKELGDKKEIPINFADKADFSKVAKMSANSSALTINFLGDEKNDKQIKIPNYSNGQTKEQDIERFKNDIARELKTDQKNIEVFSADNEVVARKKGTDDRYIVKFDDSRDNQRFLDYASNSPSRRLADFGIKQHEGEIRTGFSTNVRDPKNGTNFSTGITYGTFIGDHQRVIVNANFGQNIADPLSAKSLQNVELRYQNLDVPFLGDYGEISLKYNNGKLDFGGKSEAIDIMASDMSKQYLNDLKSGDPKSIAIAAGALAVVAGGLYIAKEKLPEAQDLNVPLKAKIYGNGSNRVNAIVEPTIRVGGGELGVSLYKLGLEADQNIASGQNFRERVIYDFKDKSVEVKLQGTYNNLYASAEAKYSKETPEQNRANLQVGYNQIIDDKSSVNYYFAQNFNQDYKPTDTSANVGYSYRPNKDWTVNAGVGLSKTEASEKVGAVISTGISYRF
ncbi:MAG: hypothetical protein AABZ74_01765 [Cyanobacteriota bacterium]